MLIKQHALPFLILLSCILLYASALPCFTNTEEKHPQIYNRPELTHTIVPLRTPEHFSTEMDPHSRKPWVTPVSDEGPRLSQRQILQNRFIDIVLKLIFQPLLKGIAVHIATLASLLLFVASLNILLFVLVVSRNADPGI